MSFLLQTNFTVNQKFKSSLIIFTNTNVTFGKLDHIFTNIESSLTETREFIHKCFFYCISKKSPLLPHSNP